MSDERNTEELIAEFLKNGGEIIKLRYASEKDQNKASRKWYHREKALCGNEKSKEFVEKEAKKEDMMIFSKADRWRE
ncbi:MAG: hypothetical protein MK009_05895 [Gammaproteobacteria bacterium]|nr:hypothetical protein [Gammaproteobacteria bacterium]